MLPKLWPRELAEPPGWIAAVNVEVAQDGGAKPWIALGVGADHVLCRELRRTIAGTQQIDAHAHTHARRLRNQADSSVGWRVGSRPSERAIIGLREEHGPGTRGLYCAYGLTGTVGVSSVMGITSGLPYVAHVEE